MPVLTGSRRSVRRELLVEHYRWTDRPNNPPTYCAIETRRYVFVRYGTREEELYDLKADPSELKNRAGKPSSEHIAHQLRNRVRALCRPRPPGMRRF